ncbi:MAG: threonyl-tRNA synthetase editing domain-containing protein [Promethearchaeia archaeon]
MRFLSFHCDFFEYITTKKSRSPLIEKLTEDNKSGRLENVLVLFISVEKKDESDQKYLKKAFEEIRKISKQLAVKNIVVLSFAHLFANLSSPKFALKALKKLERELKMHDYQVLRPPFGWFNELEMKAKGHPLSRISRKL